MQDPRSEHDHRRTDRRTGSAVGCGRDRLRVLAWNVGHQIYPKVIPDTLAVIVDAVDVDLLFLTEFVDGPTRSRFRAQLADLGYFHQLLSQAPCNSLNRVFAASRRPISVGDISPPTMDGFAVSNFLHVRVDDCAIEAIGLRAPWYETAKERRIYRAELITILTAIDDRAMIVAGDLNEDPFETDPNKTVNSVPFKGAETFSVANPSGPWSFMNTTSTSRIDHVMHTEQVKLTDVTYRDTVDKVPLAGLKSLQPISDHAALTFTAELASSTDEQGTDSHPTRPAR